MSTSGQIKVKSALIKMNLESINVRPSLLNTQMNDSASC